MLTLPYIQKQTPYMGTCLLCYSHLGFSTFREWLSHSLAVVICLEFIREPCAPKDQHEPSGRSQPHLWLERTPLKYQQCIWSFGQMQTSLRKLDGFPARHCLCPSPGRIHQKGTRGAEVPGMLGIQGDRWSWGRGYLRSIRIKYGERETSEWCASRGKAELVKYHGKSALAEQEGVGEVIGKRKQRVYIVAASIF